MAVLVEGTSVIVLNAALERRFPGGSQAFRERFANQHQCSDGTLFATLFTTTEDAWRFTNVLMTYGFSDPWRVSADDIAVAFEDAGFATPCAWLSIGQCTLPDEEDWATQVTVACLADEVPTTFSPPPGWLPSKKRGIKISADELEHDYEIVGEDPVGDTGARLVAYRHRRTGKSLYVPRAPDPTDADTANLIRLTTELSEVIALRISRQRDQRLTELYHETTRAISSGSSHPGWLQLHVQIAVLTSHWKAAEQALRQLTQIRPESVDAWINLTMVLARLDRLDEAEAVGQKAVAIDPTSAGAYGNLARVLWQQGKTEAATRAIDRSVELNPSIAANQEFRDRILERIRADSMASASMAEEDVADTTAVTPWYKRLFRGE